MEKDAVAERFSPPNGSRQGGLLLPPGSPRPCDGGFSVDEADKTRLVTPSDELTGVPSVLMPVTDLPPISLDEKNVERVADWHHPFHPRAKLVNQTPGLAALRMVRKQWALYNRHHNDVPEGYHSIFGGPLLPETEQDQFRTVVFAAAGFIPRLAIDFHKNQGHRLKPLTDEQRLQLWQSGQIRIDNPMTVRDFLIEHALSGSFVDINSTDVHEFLHTPKLERRVQLGNMLLRAAAQEATAPISLIYRKAKKEELIPIYRAHTAGQFVLYSMNLAKGRSRAHIALKQRLEAA